MCLYRFHLVKLDPGTHFSLQRQSSSSHLVFYHRSRGMSYSKQNSDEIEFIEVETAIKIKLCAILEQLNQRRNRTKGESNFVDDCVVEEEEKDLSTQFLQMPKLN